MSLHIFAAYTFLFSEAGGLFVTSQRMLRAPGAAFRPPTPRRSWVQHHFTLLSTARFPRVVHTQPRTGTPRGAPKEGSPTRTLAARWGVWDT